MSRSDYSKDGDSQELALWRGAVRSAINGARGQAMLRELAPALDAMPKKTLETAMSMRNEWMGVV